jgi:hypothetical protein
LLQFQQRRQINARRAHHHLRTRDRIEHPAGDGDDDACRPLHLHKLARCSLLYAPNKNLAPEIGMPRVMDFQLLRDMGRMNGRWLWAGSLGCSADPIAVANVRLPYTA